MKSIRFAKKFWVTVGTMIVMGVGFAVYFLGYVKDREKEFIGARYRILERTASNIENAKIDFKKITQLTFNSLVYQQISYAT